MAYCEKCLKQCETGQQLRDEKNTIKGALGEASLMCILMDLQRKINCKSFVVKGLFVQDPYTAKVTELDLTLVTEYAVFLFECKSYQGKKKTIKDNCTLVRDGREFDVFSQNTLHLTLFNKRYGGFMKQGSKPYKFALYDFSTTPFEDLREEKYKSLMPVLTQDTVSKFVIETINKHRKEKGAVIDFYKIQDAIKRDVTVNDSKFKKAHKQQLMY